MAGTWEHEAAAEAAAAEAAAEEAVAAAAEDEEEEAVAAEVAAAEVAARGQSLQLVAAGWQATTRDLRLLEWRSWQRSERLAPTAPGTLRVSQAVLGRSHAQSRLPFERRSMAGDHHKRPG